MLGHLWWNKAIKRSLWFPRAICKVKQALESAWMVIEAWLPKPHDCHQDAQDQDDDRQQIDVVRQPRFLYGHGICKEGRDEFLWRHGGAHRVGLLLSLLDFLLFDPLSFNLALLLLAPLFLGSLRLDILLLTIEAERPPLGNGKAAGSAFLHAEHGLGNRSGHRLWRQTYPWFAQKCCRLRGSHWWLGAKDWRLSEHRWGLGENDRVSNNRGLGDFRSTGNVDRNCGNLLRTACSGRFDRLLGFPGRWRGYEVLPLLRQIEGRQGEAGHAFKRDQIALFKSRGAI